MYEVMAAWESIPGLADQVVYSTTLESAPTRRTRIERNFDATAVRRMKAALASDISVGGRPALPAGVRLTLDLVDERRFGSGFVHLHFRVGRPSPREARGHRAQDALLASRQPGGRMAAPDVETLEGEPLRVAYVAGDGPLHGWAYAADRRLLLNEELELSVKDGYSAVYRVGQGCQLWFVRLLPPTS